MKTTFGGKKRLNVRSLFDKKEQNRLKSENATIHGPEK